MHSPVTETLAQHPQSLSEELLSCTLPHISHRIAAGFPSPATDYVEEGLDLNAYLIQHKVSTFVFTVKGDSMIGAGILSGDKLVVDRSIEARHKQIVVAVINQEYTVKRLYKRAGVIELRPEIQSIPPFDCAISMSCRSGV